MGKKTLYSEWINSGVTNRVNTLGSEGFIMFSAYKSKIGEMPEVIKLEIERTLIEKYKMKKEELDLTVEEFEKKMDNDSRYKLTEKAMLESFQTYLGSLCGDVDTLIHVTPSTVTFIRLSGISPERINAMYGIPTNMTDTLYNTTEVKKSAIGAYTDENTGRFVASPASVLTALQIRKEVLSVVNELNIKGVTTSVSETIEKVKGRRLFNITSTYTVKTNNLTKACLNSILSNINRLPN